MDCLPILQFCLDFLLRSKKHPSSTSISFPLSDKLDVGFTYIASNQGFSHPVLAIRKLITQVLCNTCRALVIRQNLSTKCLLHSHQCWINYFRQVLNVYLITTITVQTTCSYTHKRWQLCLNNYLYCSILITVNLNYIIL